jgi:hypothetical protein
LNQIRIDPKSEKKCKLLANTRKKVTGNAPLSEKMRTEPMVSSYSPICSQTNMRTGTNDFPVHVSHPLSLYSKKAILATTKYNVDLQFVVCSPASSHSQV